jgi:hypothetical protein
LNFKHLSIKLIAAIYFLFGTVSAISAEEVWASDGGSFNVSYTSKLVPIPINQIHQWVLHIESTSGDSVSGISIELIGGMPLHDHGLPTSPVATEYLGEGDFLIEGMRFHMMGEWEITLTLSIDNLNETVLIPLRI